MAKCSNCGGELHPQENGLRKCAECGKLFRMKQKTPPESDMNAGAPQAQTPPASERNVTEPPVQTEPSAPADEAQTAEREELAVLRARIAAMEAKQAELERGATAKQRESGAGAAVLSFLKKWGFKVVLPVGLLLIALITLLVCFCGVRGIYVNIDDPNEFYSFDATNYEYHGIFMGEEYVDKGTWKKSGGQLELTYKDEDFGKVTESYDFSSLDSNNTIFISDDFGNKGEFKRVSLLAYGTSKKIKITLDGNGGSGGDSHKVQIGSKIQEPAEPTRDGYMFMGWYTSKEGWKNAEAKRIDFDDRVWEDVTYYANWKNTTPFNLTGDGLDEPVKFTEGDDVESLYMSARGWNSLPDGVTGLIFKDASGNEIDPSFPPLDNIHVTVVYDVRIENSTLLYVTPVLTEYIIPASVTNIASGAFDGCTELETVYIASRSSALTVQEGAFDECEKLSLVAGYADSTAMRTTLEASGVTRAHITAGAIASSAFDGCTTLTSVTIGDGVTSIGGSAFAYCTSLTSITIPDSVTSIGYSAFMRCSSLTSVTIGDGVTSIGYRAFYNCSSLTSVTIGDGVTSIGGSAFAYCTSLTSVTIPDSVTSIGDSAFQYCDFLTSVTIGNGVTSIGSSAFSDCSRLASVTIPDSVTSIGEYAFSGCDSLTSITIPDSVTSIGSGAFYDCISLTSVTIGNSVTSIGEYAFYDCISLTSVTIGNSVTSIGRYAFNDCTSLTAIAIPDSVTSIENYAFYSCDSLTSVTIGNGVTSIGSSAFSDCSRLTSVTIPDSVTSIGWSAFAYCTSLTSVTIGNSVTSIRESAFSWCTGLTSIHYTGDMVSWLEKNWHRSVMSGGRVLCIDGTKVEGKLVIPNGIASIPSYAFAYQTGITSITIPDGVTSIGGSAFNNCTSLEAVYITDIGKWVAIDFTEYDANPLYYAGNLYLNGELVTDLVIPNGVTSIGSDAFRGCTSLTSVTIPDSVTSIGSDAFAGCTDVIEKENGVSYVDGWAISFDESI